jgi:hypothetical protein
MNEQIILGFAQYALYNHLKWKDILEHLDMLEESRTAIASYQRKYCATDTNNIDDEGETDEAWYWWKMIPKGVVLPERLMAKLISLLVEYPDQQYDACVPKTCQPLNNREMTDDIWETFWDTYVEPSHVSHLFTAAMEAVLTYDDDLEWDKYCISPEEGADFMWAQRLSTSERVWGMVCHSGSSDVSYPMNFFTYREYPEGETVLTSPDDYVTRFIRIFDRDMFGTYEIDVINYQYDWDNFRRRNIINRAAFQQVANEYSFDAAYANIWFPPNPRIVRSPGVGEAYLRQMSMNVESRIGFEDTSYWEYLRYQSNNIDSDYSNERSFRENLTIDTEESDEHVVDRVNVLYETDEWPPIQGFGEDETLEYEVEEEEEAEVVGESKKMVEKLKELQILVDEKVKDCVPEGVYLDVMNNLCEMYKLTNSIHTT